MSYTPSIFALQPEAAQSQAAEAAGFWIRGAARVIDWVVIALVAFVSMVIVAFVVAVIAALAGRSADAIATGLGKSSWISWIGNTIAAVAYHACFEGIAGVTIGKRVVGLQILTESLQPISFLQGVRRSVAFLVDALFFGAIAASHMSGSPTKQRIGDEWAQTRVVRRRSVPPHLHSTALRMLGGFALGAFVAGVLTAITQVLEAIRFLS